MSRSRVLLLLFLFVGLGTVGFLDDFIKIYKQRNLGLRSKAKFIGQTVVALAFAAGWCCWRHAPVHRRTAGVTPAGHAISFTRDIDKLALPTVVLVVFIVLLIAGDQQRRQPHRRARRARRRRLDDGLRGLHAGEHLAEQPVLLGRTGSPGLLETGSCYDVRDPLDLAVVAAAITGACFGFLWYNASPAQIFMGDTGSLALGGAVAGMAVLTRTELLLALLGGLFVLQTMSVILQVGFFKLTNGKRLFRMAPLHHHFELLGWEEITVVVRFWLIAAVFVAAGLGIFYAEWVAGA